VLRRACLCLGLAALLASPAVARPVTLTAQDRFDIEQLYYAYSKGKDSGDGKLRASTFTAHGVMLSDVNHHTAEGIASVARRTGDGTQGWGGRHRIFNIVLTPTETGVDGTCYVLISDGKDSHDGALIAFPGIYHDRLVKMKTGWRFASREVWNEREPTSPYRGRP
jgi:hypothetical protein